MTVPGTRTDAKEAHQDNEGDPVYAVVTQVVHYREPLAWPPRARQFKQSMGEQDSSGA